MTDTGFSILRYPANSTLECQARDESEKIKHGDLFCEMNAVFGLAHSIYTEAILSDFQR